MTTNKVISKKEQIQKQMHWTITKNQCTKNMQRKKCTKKLHSIEIRRIYTKNWTRKITEKISQKKCTENLYTKMHRKSAQKKFTEKMHSKMHWKNAHKKCTEKVQRVAGSNQLYFSIALHVTGSYGVPYYIIVFI